MRIDEARDSTLSLGGGEEDAGKGFLSLYPMDDRYRILNSTSQNLDTRH